MSRLLRAGTVIDVADHPIDIILEADVPVTDIWGSDDHFAGWAFLTGNLPLYVDDLAVYDVIEVVDGVRQHNVYHRVYGVNAIKELTLVSSENLPEDFVTEEEKAQQAAAQAIADAAAETKKREAERLKAEAAEREKAEEARLKEVAKLKTAESKSAKKDVLDKSHSKPS